MEPLENMVDMTAKLFECDRDDMYHYLLRLCSRSHVLEMRFQTVDERYDFALTLFFFSRQRRPMTGEKQRQPG